MLSTFRKPVSVALQSLIKDVGQQDQERAVHALLLERDHLRAVNAELRAALEKFIKAN
jgi:hypothetical protein